MSKVFVKHQIFTTIAHGDPKFTILLVKTVNNDGSVRLVDTGTWRPAIVLRKREEVYEGAMQ